MSVQIQQQNVPLAKVMVNGQELPAYITQEHRRPLEELANTVNLLLARLKAAGIP